MSYEPPTNPSGEEWFAQEGLSFSCTMCGNCCTGPQGYVLVNDQEITALAKRLNISFDDFCNTYTHTTLRGRSLTERLTTHGYDCTFLDRDKFPGKAVCGVYEDRPAQCRTWPFWKSNLTNSRKWELAKQTCPGMDKGKHFQVHQIRILRDVIDI